jgi:hypothetical protein
VITRDIRPSTAYTSCEVCGRTLLRGERAQVYLDGAARRWVCELCTTRAVQEGWIREGTLPTVEEGDGRSERGRSLIGRLRRRRERKPPREPQTEMVEEHEWTPPPPPVPAPTPRRQRERPREPRRVHAVPTSDEHKIASAVELFNDSEHRRTVAGVARSLGPPDVSVRPATGASSVVNIVVAWELCWYRYEVDLSDDLASVRVADQGIELDELAPEEREPNAISDETGSLVLDS